MLSGDFLSKALTCFLSWRASSFFLHRGPFTPRIEVSHQILGACCVKRWHNIMWLDYLGTRRHIVCFLDYEAGCASPSNSSLSKCVFRLPLLKSYSSGRFYSKRRLLHTAQDTFLQTKMEQGARVGRISVLLALSIASCGPQLLLKIRPLCFHLKCRWRIIVIPHNDIIFQSKWWQCLIGTKVLKELRVIFPCGYQTRPCFKIGQHRG